MAQGILEDIECRLATMESLLRIRHDGTSELEDTINDIAQLKKRTDDLENALSRLESKLIVQRSEALERRIDDLTDRDELAKIVRDVASSQPGMVPIKAMYLAREWVKKQGDE